MQTEDYLEWLTEEYREQENENRRLSALRDYPFCVLYGIWQEEVLQLLRQELRKGLGDKEADWTCITKAAEFSEGMSEVIDSFRKREEQGKFPVFQNGIVFLFLKADGFLSDTIRSFQKTMEDLFHKKGYSHLRMILYVLFDYEYMDGIQFQQELAVFLASGEENCSIGIVTQDNRFVEEERKYRHALQAVIHHIFLTSSNEELNEYPLFTIGSHRQDLVYQAVMEWVCETLRNQLSVEETEESYQRRILENLEKETELPVNTLMDAFERGPICFDEELEKWLHLPAPFWGKYFSCGELMRMCYGYEDGFQRFVRQNTVWEGEEENFLSQKAGSYPDMEKQLLQVLGNLERQYAQGLERCRNEHGNECRIKLNQKTSLEEIKHRLRKNLWEQEITIMQFERRLVFVRKLEEIIRTETFQNRFRQELEDSRNLYERVKRRIKQSAIQKKEPLVMFENQESDKKMYYGRQELLWEKCPVKQIYQLLEQKKQSEVRLELLRFMQTMEETKREQKSDFYYAAKLHPSSLAEEQDFLFASEKHFQEILDKKEEEIREDMGYFAVKIREWISPFSFELFCIKRLNDLTEIYGID